MVVACCGVRVDGNVGKSFGEIKGGKGEVASVSARAIRRCWAVVELCGW